MITLEGASGSGKTRLGTEFLQWCSVQNATILQGHAFEGSSTLPFQPLIDALRVRIEQENAPDDLLPDVWLAELSRLLPELRERYPDLVVPHNEDAIIRTQIFEAVARLCHALSRQRVLVLFLDDLHWANPDLLGGIYYLIQRWQQSCSAIMVILSFRPDQENNAATSLTDWSKKLRRLMPSVVHQPLQPFLASDILYLLQSLTATIQEETLFSFALPAETSAEHLDVLAEKLYALTNGHVLYTIETIKSLIEQKAFSSLQKLLHTHEKISDLVQDMLPASIQEHILLCLKQSTPAAQALAMAIAIQGPDASFEQLCGTAKLSENESLAALDELQDLALLRQNTEQDEHPYRYLFTYSKTSEILKATASKTRYQLMLSRTRSAAS
ncbi:hypothetical protein KDW_58350 [Dictyobacter vulcani]|uniref:Orc1-like AAA ATPase domain-containing protein n=1 Tax=Dictyobacter vulcani TaxID=2607529 RepID=A0A5J4KVZ8_9CHLR|nr:AAA family ATPase [Dictyobacter vulcani]GER91673.1 hypothetical protein KDW_58350 [Dictyobacter vulcani]